MNTLRFTRHVIALTLFAAAGCAPQGKIVPLQRAQTVPAAHGRVQAERTDQGNTRVEVEVEHLAPPQNVAPGAQAYVVWAHREAKDAPPQNIGALIVDKDLKGKLETVTPLEKFHVSITPEASPNAQAPTNEPIMSADVVTKE